VSSENSSGADNQQETVRSMFDLDPRWVVGFVDGEGCFSVSIQDFLRFADIVGAMRRKDHLRPEGFERLVRLADAMNADGKQRVAASTRS
jgi:hypothetical protein